MLKILVTSGGSFQGSTLIKCLALSRRIQIHLADCYRDNINKYNVDYWHVVPPISESQKFLSVIESIVKGRHIDILFPATDHELDLLSRNKHLLESYGVKLALSNHHLLSVLRNKIETQFFCEKFHLPVLSKINIQEDQITFPLIGKPSQGFGAKDIIIVNDEEELRTARNYIGDRKYLWQNFLTNFVEFSTDFAIGFDGSISPIIVRKRVRTSGGFAVIAHSEYDDEIEHTISNLAKILKTEGGRGLFNAQILRTHDGQYYISDINPRVGTSAIFSLGVGINLPLFMCAALDESITYSKVHIPTSKKVKMIRNLDERWITTVPTDSIKGVVFDLDDTLIHQKQWIFDKLNLLHNHFTKELPDKKIFLSAAFHLIEEGKRSTLIDELIRHFSLKGSIKNQMIETYRLAVPDNIFVYRDVAYTLERLKKKGFKLGLLTDNPPISQKQKIDKLKFAHLFDTIILSQELNTEKPDKVLFSEAAERLTLKPESIAMVGDNLYRDIYGCINANYGAAIFIERKGSFFNFDYDLFSSLMGPEANTVIKIHSFNELYFIFCDS